MVPLITTSRNCVTAHRKPASAPTHCTKPDHERPGRREAVLERLAKCLFRSPVQVGLAGHAFSFAIVSEVSRAQIILEMRDESLPACDALVLAGERARTSAWTSTSRLFVPIAYRYLTAVRSVMGRRCC